MSPKTDSVNKGLMQEPVVADSLRLHHWRENHQYTICALFSIILPHMYAFLDIFFLVFHTSLIIFNLFGWMWKKTRLANLALLALTGASWFILGLFYGIGYCPCTDWHWKVLRAMGREDLPISYVKYLADAITGLDFDARLVDTCVAAGYFLALIASIFVNVRDYRSRRAAVRANAQSF